ncbi:hypothetical protein RGF97_13215 [Streptomyces roseicoloratus]|uniref:Uncharacterized protein n=1 Tax=Streptomyces roseicoloratus TaxID=2508722 RepID=A0ABY9RUG6_9ACTN|nr:hypothetical protein [Streptomyces roseicoloratus]WMX45620.1 hypothetical protein RGF97_13215 [Streptomyces roseicoloratus]
MEDDDAFPEFDDEFPEFDEDDEDDDEEPEDGPEALEPAAFPEGAQEDRVRAAALMVVRYCSLLLPVVATPWFGPVRNCLIRAHGTAELLLREGYGPDGAVGAFDIGLTRWILKGVTELPEAARRPEESVDGQRELARAAYDVVADPADEERFAEACALAERLAGPEFVAEERELRARDLAELAEAREGGREPDTEALWARADAFAGRYADRLRTELRAAGHHIGEEMTDFPVPVTERGADTVRHIVAALAGRFGVSEEEARVRVFAYFADWDLTDESEVGDLDHIGHQTPEEWAGRIYLGLEFHEVGPAADLSGHEPWPLPE